MIVEVKYHTFAAFSNDCLGQLSQGGLFLRLTRPLEQYQQLRIRLLAPSGETFDLNGRVLQVISGQGLAVEFPGLDEELLARLSQHARRGGSEAAGNPGEEPEVRIVPEKPATGRDDMAKPSRRSLPAQLEEMTVAQKRQAALHGNKDMRWALIRDRNKTLHPFVLKNPALTLDEVEQIAKLPSVNPDALRAIARSREWTRSQSVCRNLVRNPKTPLKEALQLLQKLPHSEVRALARSNNVRTPIQQAARKIVVK